MAGIIRIEIESDWNNDRLKMSRDLAPAANDLYFRIWSDLGMPLQNGIEIIRCTKEEAEARYDWREGIDVILNYQNGHRATKQEKFLDYWQSTMTFTEHQRNNVPGNWYTCTAQYWFTGYARKYWDEGILEFQDWMLIDLPGLRRIDATINMPWVFKDNNNPGFAGIQFRYLLFDEVPDEVIIARYQSGSLVKQPELW